MTSQPSYDPGILPDDEAARIEAAVDADVVRGESAGDNIRAHYEALTEKAARLVAVGESVDIQLGALLAELIREDVPAKLGYAKQDQYWQERIGIGRRKGYHMISIHRVFEKSGVAQDKLTRLGWTKAAMIASIYPNNATPDASVLLAFVDYALKTDANGRFLVSATELNNRVDAFRAKQSGGDAVQKAKKTWVFRADEIAWVEHAIDLARSKFADDGEVSDSRAIARIVQEWELLEVQGLSLDDCLRLVEGMHNVRLTVED